MTMNVHIDGHVENETSESSSSLSTAADATSSSAAAAAAAAAAGKARKLVERFYYRGWNHRDPAVLRDCLAPNVKFRGGLGMKRGSGVEKYIAHVKNVQNTIARYSIGIDDMVVSGNGTKVAVRCTSRGLHSGTFFGVKGHGCEVFWTNAAFLTIDGQGKIVDLWILGDMDCLKHQVGASPDASQAFSVDDVSQSFSDRDTSQSC
jgi:predicted ester cyclase